MRSRILERCSNCALINMDHVLKKYPRPEVNFPTMFTLAITISAHANGATERKTGEIGVCLK